MAEPHSTAVGAFTGAGISSVSVVFGAHVDALIVGLIAAMFISIWLGTIDTKLKAASAVLFAALLAAYGSPVAASWLAASVPSIASNADALRMLLALVIGGGAPSAVPIAIRYMGRKGDAL